MCSFTSEELVLIASIIAIKLSENLNNSEINVLGNFLSTIGQNLSLIAAQNEACEDDNKEMNKSRYA
jgi:hypothetical protein